MAADSNRIGRIVLRRVQAVDAKGVPTLEGTNARILCAGRLGSEDIGNFAACQDTHDDTGPITFVLGIVGEERAADAPVVLSAGAASISLYPDGHIRLQGEDVTVDSAGKLRFLAGRIDLN